MAVQGAEPETQAGVGEQEVPFITRTTPTPPPAHLPQTLTHHDLEARDLNPN